VNRDEQEPGGDAPEALAEGGGEEEPSHPPMREFMERSLGRLAMEAVLGATGGMALSVALPQGEGRQLTFALVGAVAAPLALMLTPAEGPVARRAFRYGLALSVLLSILISFVVGADHLLLEELIAFGLLIFAIGFVGHGAVAMTLDRGAEGEASG